MRTHDAAPPTQFAAKDWCTKSLTDNRAWTADSYWITERAKQNKYSFRMLRYWYVERLLAHERIQANRPLAVLEIGVDRGQMKAFIDGAPDSKDLYSTWDAADVKPQIEALTASGYGGCHAVNLDDEASLTELAATRQGQYDVVIVLHILEHLHAPERAMNFISKVLKPDGIVLGGFPVLPPGIASLRQAQIKRTAQPFGHVSAFSPYRVRQMAAGAGLKMDYASGAFAVRVSGSSLESKAWWMRWNVTFGALFPSWPGEIYWQMRK
jgi:SAM-dependent methyltransferase